MIGLGCSDGGDAGMCLLARREQASAPHGRNARIQAHRRGPAAGAGQTAAAVHDQGAGLHAAAGKFIFTAIICSVF